MIEPKDVKKMAGLARIELKPKEEKKLAKDLESILGYIDKLKEVGVDGVGRAEHVFALNDFRKDEPSKEAVAPMSLIESAPETERGFVKVKKVLDKE
ncbi:MAG: Asp-tRNA(Asn)/Glu-tRNA(Gln) amidotransferase subunit GatC [Candidatus Niyogibacteria bacterium]|nr:Asp-tRNA(Asn)/Glu-tRNA(Gln) amidotransferase subunit GatC [Candidatus Niyogibacteria bacterium]